MRGVGGRDGAIGRFLRAQWVPLVLVAILGLAASFRLLWLSQNGYGRLYYAAGVRSMLASWHNFFFNSFDPAGFVSLDKPPVAIWLQVALAKLIGFGPLAMLLPQVLQGLAAILVLYAIVRGSAGALAGLLAALFLALTPISIAVDRSNNAESCLLLLLLLAAWLLTRALQTGRLALLTLTMACMGLAFNVKMAAALVPLPAMALAYLALERSRPWPARVLRLGAGGLVLAVVALAWTVAFDAVPSRSRPYAGSTQHNSMLELAVLHNGVARFTRSAGGPHAERSIPDQQNGAGPRQPLWNVSPTGFLRLLLPQNAAQVGWLLPLALAALALGAVDFRNGRLPRTWQIALAVWGGWLASYWMVLSYAGGVVHTYYLAVLAPPICALAAMAVVELWERSPCTWLPGALAATGAWSACVAADSIAWQIGHWTAWLFAGMAVGVCLACVALFLRGTPVALAGALVALMALPTAWASSVVLVRPNVAAPAADLSLLRPVPAADEADRTARARRAAEHRRKLIGFLLARHSGERFILAVPSALQAAPLIVATGKPVMAMGGYLGRDPILTPAALHKLVAEQQVRFIMTGGPSLVPAHPRQREIADWVRANGTLVDRSLWLPHGTPTETNASVRGRAALRELYDMRPGEKVRGAASDTRHD